MAISLGEILATLRLKDEMSGAAKAAASSIQNMGATMKASSPQIKDLESQLKSAQSRVDDLNAAAKAVGLQTGAAFGTPFTNAKQKVADLEQELKAAKGATEETAKSTNELAKAQDKAAESSKQSQFQTQALTWRVRELGMGLTHAGLLWSAGITAPIVGAGVAAIKFGSDFEREMMRVQTLGGAGATEISNLRQKVLDLAPSVGVGPVELAKALFPIESEGFRGAQAMDMLDKAAKGSAMGMGDADVVSRMLVTTMKAYQKEGISASEVMDVLFSTIQKADVPVDAFAKSLGRVTSISAAAHVPLSEVGAAMATFTRVGVSADIAATGLRAVLIGLESPTTKAGKALTEMYGSVQNVRDAIAKDGLAKFLVDMNDRLNGSSDALRQIFPNFRAFTLALADARSQGQDYLKVAEEIRQAHGVFGEGFKQTAQTLTQKWNEIKAALEVVAIRLADALIPRLKELVPLFERVIGHMLSIVDAFVSLPAPVQMTAIALLGVTAAIGPLLMFAGQLAMIVSSLTGIFGPGAVAGAAAGFTSVLGPLAIAVGAVVAVMGTAYAITGSWKGALEAMFVPFDGTIRLLGIIADKLGLNSQVMDDIVRIIKDSLIIGFDAMKNSLSEMAKGLEAWGRIAKVMVQESLEEFKALVTMVASSLPSGMRDGLMAVAALAGIVMPSLKSRIHEAADEMDRLANKSRVMGDSAKVSASSVMNVGNLLTGGILPQVQRFTGGILDLSHALGGKGGGGGGGAGGGSAGGGTSIPEASAEAIHALSLLNVATSRAASVAKQAAADFQRSMADIGKGWAHLPVAPWEDSTWATRVTLAGKDIQNVGMGLINVDQVAATAAKHIHDVIDGANKDWRKSLDDLSKTFTHLAQIAGGAMDGLARTLATVVASIDATVKSIDSITTDQKGFGGFLTKISGWAGLATVAVSGLSKVWSHFFGTAGRDEVQKFVDSFGGFESFHKMLGEKLPQDAERLWIALTQGVGRNNPEQAKKIIEEIRTALSNIPPTMEEVAAQAGYKTTAELQQIANDAVKLWEYMRDSGKYTAEQVQDAWQKAQDALIASGDTTAIAVKKAQDAVTALDNEIAQLQASVDAEAPEEFMGIVEQQQRAKLESLKEQREEAAKTLETLTQQMTDSLNEVAQAIKELPKEIEIHFRGFFDNEGSSKVPEHGEGGHFSRRQLGIIGDESETILPDKYIGDLAAAIAALGGVGGDGGGGDIVIHHQTILGDQVVERSVERVGRRIINRGGWSVNTRQVRERTY